MPSCDTQYPASQNQAIESQPEASTPHNLEPFRTLDSLPAEQVRKLAAVAADALEGFTRPQVAASFPVVGMAYRDKLDPNVSRTVLSVSEWGDVKYAASDLVGVYTGSREFLASISVSDYQSPIPALVKALKEQISACGICDPAFTCGETCPTCTVSREALALVIGKEEAWKPFDPILSAEDEDAIAENIEPTIAALLPAEKKSRAALSLVPEQMTEVKRG